jgi:Bacterial Ig-like domain (group 3)/NHL repeat
MPNADSRPAEPSASRRTRRAERLSSRVKFKPQVAFLEQRTLLSALPTLTAISASSDSGEPTFTATVTDLSPGGATPTGGTITFSDQNGTIDSATLVNGVATFRASSLPAGTITVNASYGGTASFAASATGTIVTAAGDGTAGDKGDNGSATAAELSDPWGIAVDSAGDLFIADHDSNEIREVVKSTGKIITVAGDGEAGYSGDNGPATDAELRGPNTVAVDSAGDLFISDTGNNVIREVVKATGKIVTIAGTGTPGYTGDGGPAIAAEIDSPRGITVDSAGNVYFADNPNNVIREIVNATGKIFTVAGDGTPGYKGDGGLATAAELNGPNTVVVNSAGDLFIGDANNNAIREVATNGYISTIAGTGKAGYSGDNGPATAAQESGALGVAVDSLGDVFIADTGNNRVREIVAATGDIITVAGTGASGYTGDNGPATTAELDAPPRVAIDSAGDLFVTDAANNVVRELTPAVTVTISPQTPGGGGGGGGGGSGGGDGGGGGSGGGGGTQGPRKTPPTPPPAAPPLPAGFLRTPPKIVGITTKMADRTPEILIQLNQGIEPERALEKDRYSVDTSGAEGALETTSGGSRIKISRVEYRAKSDTIILALPRRPKVQGNVVLTVDPNGIVNLLGQALEGDSVNSGVNLIQEVDLP